MTRKILERGFSIVEMLVTVAVIGILSAAVIANSGDGYRRDRINSVATDLAAWLEAVQHRAMSMDQGCRVTINPSPNTNLAPGTVIATVAPVNTSETLTCSPDTSFRIPATGGLPSDRFSVGGLTTDIVFTRRGSIVFTDNSQVATNQDIRLLLTPGPLRCVRISARLGAIRVGNSTDTNISSATCDFSRI